MSDNDIDASSDEERPRTPNYDHDDKVVDAEDVGKDVDDGVVKAASLQSKSSSGSPVGGETNNQGDVLEEESEQINNDNEEPSPTNVINDSELNNEDDNEDEEKSVGDKNEANENGELQEKTETSKSDVNVDDDKPFSKENTSNAAYDDDLLPISDLSVDLTGDEAAIVDDILQSTGDGDLNDNTEETRTKEAEEERTEVDEEVSKTSKKSAKDDQDEPAAGTGELLADIFGSSDEDEEFEGFEKDELQPGTRKRKSPKKGKREKRPVIASDDEEEEQGIEKRGEEEPQEEEQGVEEEEEKLQVKAEGEEEEEEETPKESLVVPPPEDESDSEDESNVFVSDFELMMQQKKDTRKIHRRRKDVDIINDNDDLVVHLISAMKEAAEEDKLANKARQAATKKLVLLPTVMKHMLKIHLMTTFLDCNVLPVLKEWVGPLPDNSLPNLQIREGVLNILTQLPAVDSGTLKVSGIGRAVMCLFKHPKETRKNKEICGKLISDWSRPIFGVTANFKSISREEREERDYANMSKRRRLSSEGAGGRTPKRIENAIQNEQKGLRPGEKGWCMRARVPAPSNKDYVVRPKSNIDIEFSDFSTKIPKKSLNRFEQQKRKFNEKRGSAAKQRAVQISLEGNKMSL